MGPEVSEEQAAKSLPAGTAGGQLWLMARQGTAGPPPAAQEPALDNRTVALMLTEPRTKSPTDTVTPYTAMRAPAEKVSSVEEGDLKGIVQSQATVLGVIQILCSLMISGLGVILLSAPYSPHFSTAISFLLMSGYPFAGALCFGLSGSLSMIYRKKSTKTFVLSFNVISAVVAGAGLFLLAASLKTLKTATELCGSGKDPLASLPPVLSISYSALRAKDCVLAGSNLTAVLVLMLFFTILELLLAVYTSGVWWEQRCSGDPGTEYSLPRSLDIIQHVQRSLPGRGGSSS